MIRRLLQSQSATFRIAMGQAGGLISLLLIASVIGLLPDTRVMQAESRAALAEAVAVNSSFFITRTDLRRLEATLETVVDRNDDLLSAAIRRNDGRAIVAIGDHEGFWRPEESVGHQVFVPLWEGGEEWGQLEFRYEPSGPEGWQAYLYHPTMQLVGFVTLAGFIIFYFYLKSMLKQLDPSQAIPGRVRSALDTMAEGLLVLDTRQNIMLANEAFAGFVERDPDALVGLDAGDFGWLDEDGEPITAEASPWGRALETATAQMGQRIRLHLDDDRAWTFMVNCSPVLSGEARAGGVLISFDDVTELEQKEIELAASKKEADDANQAKSEFLANMSHEIRTPMNAILGFTEVLRRGYGKNPEDADRYLNTISSSGEHLLTLINDILDLSKVEAGKIELDIVSCEPHRIIHDVMRIMRVKADEKDLYLRYEPDGPLPAMLDTDPGKLRQIVTNLVGNALKFTESGGVTVRSTLHEGGASPVLGIDVIDTGIGMDAEQASKVFDSFVQADSSITRRFGGTGLGLPISKSFSEALGGDIIVTSAPGEGSTFALTLQVAYAADSPMLAPAELVVDDIAERSERGRSWSFPSAPVLVVDDGEENRALLELVLSEAGLQVDTAGNGAEALALVLDKDYDVVLMDVQMPVMDGYTAVGKIREAGLTTPVIALTAHAMEGAEQRCLDAGYSGYLSKPVDLDILMERLAGELGGVDATTIPVLEEAMTTPQGTGANPRMLALIDRFLVRMDEQLDRMSAAIEAGRLDEVADLAHWLKGSAGTVGFPRFTEPAAQMEALARAGDGDLARLMVALRSLQATATMTGAGLPAAASPAEPDALPAAGVNGRDAPPLKSAYAGTSDRIDDLIERFVLRLGEQVPAMRLALEAGELEQLAELAHWLKGSGGTVGFSDFTKPAAALEAAAKADEADGASDALAEVELLVGRITGTVTAGGATLTSTGATLVSSLPSHNPKFQELVVRFTERLGERIEELKGAFEERDYETVAHIGHWLKGSGGSVGFDEFTEPARALEDAARNYEKENCQRLMADIEALHRRMARVPDAGDAPENA